MSASSHVGRTESRRRWLLPVGRGVAYATLVVVIATAIHVATAPPGLTSLERSLVGRWFTDHSGVDTIIELRSDRTVHVTQTVRIAGPNHQSRVIPTRTDGRWRVEAGQLQMETSSSRLALSPWQKVRVFLRTQRWPGSGELHRMWDMRALTSDSFVFVDQGTGTRGFAARDGGRTHDVPVLARSSAAPP